MHPGLPSACPRRREGLLTCGGRREAPRAAGKRLGLRVAAGAVRGLRRPFLSAPGGGGLGAFTGHGRWGRGRAGSKSGRGPVPVRSPPPTPGETGSAPHPVPLGENSVHPFSRAPSSNPAQRQRVLEKEGTKNSSAKKAGFVFLSPKQVGKPRRAWGSSKNRALLRFFLLFNAPPPSAHSISVKDYSNVISKRSNSHTLAFADIPTLSGLGMQAHRFWETRVRLEGYLSPLPRAAKNQLAASRPLSSPRRLALGAADGPGSLRSALYSPAESDHSRFSNRKPAAPAPVQ